MTSFNKRIEKSIQNNWEYNALSNYKGSTLKYKDVAQRIKFLHIAFEQCGLQKGDKVALCARNQANWGVCFLAAITYGAVPVPILHDFKPDSIHYLVNHSDSKVLFVDELIWEGLSEIEMPGLKVIVQMNTMHFLYYQDQADQDVRNNLTKEFDKRYPNGLQKEDINYYEDSPEELAIINYTSGTSGFSKGVMIPYRAVVNTDDFAYLAEPHLHPGSNIVALLPSAHMYGLMFEFLHQVSVGSHIHFLSRTPSPKVILQAFNDIHPELIIAVPLIIEKVYKSKLKPILDKKKIILRLPLIDMVAQNKIRAELVKSFGGNFEEIILGGAAFNPEVEKFFHKIKFPYTVGYGMTECAPIITYAHWNRTRKYSCGQPVINMEVRIDSENPNKIPGEVQVKGPNVFLGYYKNEEATAQCFTPDGWFKTGDMGILDKDNFLFLKGRCKCMILGPSGQNIYPEELEAVVNNISYVVESLIIEEKGGGLIALIYPDYHQGELDGMDSNSLEKKLEEMLPEINKMLPTYAQIRKIEFMLEDFERTPKRSIKRYLYQRD